jgi:hypothetical protein
MAWRRQGDGQGSHPSGRALDTTLGFKEPLVLILGQPPSTTSLDPPGAEMGNLVGRDEPEHDVLEKPQQHLAMDGRE